MENFEKTSAAEICADIRAKVKGMIQEAPAANPLRMDLEEIGFDLQVLGLVLEGREKKDEILAGLGL